MKANTSKRKLKQRKNPFHGPVPESVVYRTNYGRMYFGKSEEIIQSDLERFKGKVSLIFTSPPFPLNRKKKYGNEKGNRYIWWLASFGPLFKGLLSKDGSIVIEMGNSWQPGDPVMSTLALEALLEFKRLNDLHLCQEFIWSNPAKLPSPAQWVNVERIRVKDSFTRLWWLAPKTKPKANNRRVLVDYSQSMKSLLKSGKYNAGARPSEHRIGAKSFLFDHGGAIPPSVLTIANTSANDEYLRFCKKMRITPHPARMPIDLAKFFVKFLTVPGDLVLDPFAGSNTTGAACEELGRHWISIEAQKPYIRGSKARFGKIRD